MSLANTIASLYPHLTADKVSRNVAYGVIYNNCKVGGVLLCQHEAGKRVTAQVLDVLGHESLSKEIDVKGDLDKL